MERKDVGEFILGMYNKDLVAMEKIKDLLVDLVGEIENEDIMAEDGKLLAQGRICGIKEGIELFEIAKGLLEKRIEQVEENFLK